MKDKLKFKNIFEAICTAESEAQVMKEKADKIISLRSKINKIGFDKEVMSTILGVSESTVGYVVSGKVSKVSDSDLEYMIEKLDSLCTTAEG